MKILFFLQATFFFVSGIWPLLHIKSFMRVTGPKVDIWLVRTVGLLVFSVSVGMFRAYFHQPPSFSTILIALSAALSVAAIDLYYVLSGRISRIYLIDAVIEIIFVFNCIILLFDNSTSV